eukprot:gnl/Chilomastix_cuspidata/3079.p1 GENE.gnl/Chilomastix_cuspidata/3079~~gnl/Chilomastix_cuspidata/3079.p1  ORF type:complete len:251 (+),score=40.88 gnl/Chilomastix_cuspidata/3079:176-928(+)
MGAPLSRATSRASKCPGGPAPCKLGSLPHIPLHALPALADAHARVESALAARIEAQLLHLTDSMRTKAEANLQSVRARAAVLKEAARISARKPRTPDAEARARAAAQLLGMALIEADELAPMTDADAVLAVTLARARMADARGYAGEAQLALETVLAAWPPDAACASEACAARVAQSGCAPALLAGLAGSAHASSARVSLAAAAYACAVPEAVEAIACVEAEATGLDAGHVQTDTAERLQASADCLTTGA